MEKDLTSRRVDPSEQPKLYEQLRTNLAVSLLSEFDRGRRHQNVRQDAERLFRQYDFFQYSIKSSLDSSDRTSYNIQANVLNDLSLEDMPDEVENKVKSLKEDQFKSLNDFRHEAEKWDYLHLVSSVAVRIKRSSENAANPIASYIPNIEDLQSRYRDENEDDKRVDESPKRKEDEFLGLEMKKSKLIEEFFVHEFENGVRSLIHGKGATYATRAKHLIEGFTIWQKNEMRKARQINKKADEISSIGEIGIDDLNTFIETRLERLYDTIKTQDSSEWNAIKKWLERKRIVDKALELKEKA